MACHEGLVDRAGVVVQSASDLEVGDDGAGAAASSGLEQGGQLGQALDEELGGLGAGQRPQDLIGDVLTIGAGDGGEPEGLCRLLRGGADALGELGGHLLGTDLVELVDHAQDLDEPVRVNPDRLVEALGDLTVGDVDGDRGHRQGAERLVHDEGDLDVVVERQGAVTDDVDIGLDELAEASLLGPFPAPDLLDLVALEREGQQPGIVHDVAGEGDGQVEVEPQLLARIRLRLGVGGIGLKAAEQVDLLGGLPLLRQLAQRLDGTGLDAAEAVELEGAAQDVDEVLLDDVARGEPLGEAGQ